MGAPGGALRWKKKEQREKSEYVGRTIQVDGNFRENEIP